QRFVNPHISTILKPLDDLSRAEDLQGLSKGLAFQLVESLGILFRRDVTEEVKSLDQDARASMRRYGVRFGAYHIFMPTLLKPAPAELITLLWALKNDGLDKPGFGDLIPVLAAGRTSVVTDPGFERNFYKLAGFRFLGKRAVRIDILERLADLIRPLLQWKPGTGNRPDGAYDGRRFTTTTAMLSILGATPDDMEEILKGLGYRADSVKQEEASAFLATQGGEKAEQTSGDAVASTDEAAQQEPASVDADALSAAAPAADVLAAPEAPAEPKPVLLWRPGGRNENQRQVRPQGERRNNGADHAARGEQKTEARTNGSREDKRRDGGFNGKPRDRDGKPRDNHAPRGDRNDRPPRKDRDNKPSQPQHFEAKPPRKEKPIDPDSPFAKLAALKEQMKK
ncbi:MAG TPA: helicase, partial [Rhizobium sp.]|nr:helicase [Rhizobium sp.]